MEPEVVERAETRELGSLLDEGRKGEVLLKSMVSFFLKNGE